MAIDPTSALAVSFDYSSESFDIDVTVAGPATTTHTVTTTAITDARVLLAASSADLIQKLQVWLNAPTPALPGGVSFAVAMGATGLVSITITGGTFACASWASRTIAAVLGFTAQILAGTTTATAAQRPKYLILSHSRTGSLWVPASPTRANVTPGGQSYGWRSATRAWMAKAVRFDWIPLNPTTASSQGAVQTPWDPNVVDLTTPANHAPPWGWTDNLYAAVGKTCALAEGNFQALRTSTSERYQLCAVDGGDLVAPRVERRDMAWDAWVRTDLTLHRQSTPTGTRA